jgi:hypothetical protein
MEASPQVMFIVVRNEAYQHVSMRCMAYQLGGTALSPCSLCSFGSSKPRCLHCPSLPQATAGPAHHGLVLGRQRFASLGEAAVHLRQVQARLLDRIITPIHLDFAFLLDLLKRHPDFAALVRCPPVCAFTVRRSRSRRGVLELLFADASGEVAKCPAEECLRYGRGSLLTTHSPKYRGMLEQQLLCTWQLPCCVRAAELVVQLQAARHRIVRRPFLSVHVQARAAGCGATGAPAGTCPPLAARRRHGCSAV